MIRTNRGWFKYLLLSLITLGIYSLFFWYHYIEDVNTLCRDDGDETTGLGLLILLSVLTLGIYAYVWEYKAQNRLRLASMHAGLLFAKGGGSVVLWDLLGLWIGVGPIIARHIQFKTINQLAYAYNIRLGLASESERAREPKTGTPVYSGSSTSGKTPTVTPPTRTYGREETVTYWDESAVVDAPPTGDFSRYDIPEPSMADMVCPNCHKPAHTGDSFCTGCGIAFSRSGSRSGVDYGARTGAAPSASAFVNYDPGRLPSKTVSGGASNPHLRMPGGV